MFLKNKSSLSKILLFTIGLLFFQISYAQDICPNDIQTHYQINFNVSEPTIDYNTSSRQLESISPSSDKIGLYVGDKKIEILPHTRVFTDSSTGKTCGRVADITLNFNYQPHIYVSTETQGLSCSMGRVLNHEKTHYAIEMRGIEILKPQVQAILEKYFGENIIATNRDNLQQLISYQEQVSMNDIIQVFNENTKPYHAQIDSHESYVRDSQLCSNEENSILYQRLQSN